MAKEIAPGEQPVPPTGEELEAAEAALVANTGGQTSRVL